MWRWFANEHPRSFWATQGFAFYGTVSLLYDVIATVGGPLAAPWPQRALGAFLFGGAMLWYIRRPSKPSTPAA
jgi:hypothetical protein